MLEPDLLPGVADRICLEARELAGLYGVCLDPYLAALRDQRKKLLEYDGWPHDRGDGPFFREKMISREVTLCSVDLTAEEPLPPSTSDSSTHSVHLPIVQDGRLGALALFFRAYLDDGNTLSTSPLAPKTHWGWRARDLSAIRSVSAGEQIPLAWRLEVVDGKQKLSVDLA